jgi:hypothetical protein
MSMGGAEQLRKDADLLDKMEANIRTSYGRSNLSAEELDAAMDAETYYTAEEALEKGFIDVISDANLAAASIGDMETLKAFNAIPQAKIDGIKIADKAAEILAESGTPAIEDVIETSDAPVAMTEDGFWKEYNALKDSRDFQGAQEFYAEHKSVIGQ